MEECKVLPTFVSAQEHLVGLVRMVASFVAGGLSFVGVVVMCRELAGVSCRVLGGPR